MDEALNNARALFIQFRNQSRRSQGVRTLHGLDAKGELAAVRADVDEGCGTTQFRLELAPTAPRASDPVNQA
jgi:hypothetical protein